MDLFKSVNESHEHSKQILNLLYDHDDFMDSITRVMDIGCGYGDDIVWWADVMTRDDVPEPHNYTCYALDKNIKAYNGRHYKPKNVIPLDADVDTYKISRTVDLIWCHNTLQYVENPAHTLRKINEFLVPGGVLILSVPQTPNVEFNRLVTNCYPGQAYAFNICNLIYQLASAGFDCNDGMFMKEEDSPWISAMVYKSEHKPVSPAETTWYKLMENDLLPAKAAEAVDRFGFLPQHELITRWIDQSVVLWDRV
jgi:SAM-dependent methyltransferase